MNQTDTEQKPLWIALSVFFAIVATELIAILLLNGGRFIFTLDDPYIHLALAENILNGHYGVNQAEFSAPSSSILWPLLIAPFAQFAFSAYAVLAINVAAAAGTLYLIWQILLPDHTSLSETKTQAALLIISLPTINLIGLIFTGMEHSLQLFVSTLIIYGMMVEIKRKTLPWWLIAAIIVAPLIRYECLALSLPAILFVFLRGYRAKSVLIALSLLSLLAAFAGFLLSLGLNPFPTSIMAKSSFVASSGGVMSVLSNFSKSLTSPRGVMLALMMLSLLLVSFDKNRRYELRLLAFVVAMAASMHLLVGKYGWYSRYEIYIWSSSLLTLLYLHKNRLYQLPEKIGYYKMVALMLLSVGLLCAPYIVKLVTTPLAANNTYEQQYQMHRFATEYYNKPVAVNDLGYVAYHNNNYVLDLWGLASIDALKLRRKDKRALWIDKVTEQNNVKLAMIYDKWFSKIPENWHKMGKLKLGKRRITPAEGNVTFYIVGCEDHAAVSTLLAEFTATLPAGVVFDVADNACVGATP